ncbi:DUF4468 domain-containing protein [Bacteroides ihuae]|uniref:DUF4468 domain-containing protein n=1 Tax=Bacteroides ihuae TaxID=1852362 RepID=UPI0008DA3518|nr:DUF4468 domain-containing protein [Bacteroides ihuae]
MRRILLITLLVFCTANICAQDTIDFRLQYDGSYLNHDDKKNYVVIPFEGKTKEDLYSKVLVAINKAYNSPKDVISKVDGEILSVNGVIQDCVLLRGIMGSKSFYSIQYVLQFQFKDAKVKVDAPVIVRFFSDDKPNNIFLPRWLKAEKVFKNGKQNYLKQEIINGFNKPLNNSIKNILSNMDDKQEDDW